MGPYANDPVTLCLYTPPQKLAWSVSGVGLMEKEQTLHPH